MALDITGKIVTMLPLVTGESARGGWSKQEFIVETMEQYPKKVCMSLWGDKIRELESIQPGETITASINVESREYNGRWYTEVRAWRIQRGAVGGGASVGSSMPQGPISSAKDDDFAGSGNDQAVDDLPF